MTTLHPTPEERYEEAIRKAEHDWLSEANYDAHREYFVRQELINAIREAEAAAEARGRAMEREQMRTEALKVLSHVSDDDVENGRVFDRVDAALRAHTDKENSDD